MKAIFILTLLIAMKLYSFEVPPFYEGTYVLDVNISGQTYLDRLTLEQVSYGPLVSGEFEVPNVFKVPFKGKVINQLIEGNFYAIERGKKFKVTLKGEFKGKCLISGELFNKANRFAEFSGKKEGCDE